MSASDLPRWLDARNWPWQVHVFLALAVASVLRNQVWQWYRQQVGAKRPPTEGQVRSVHVVTPEPQLPGFIRVGVFRVGSETPCYRGEIRYSYRAEGESHEGVYAREFETEEEAGEFVKRLWGRPITVRVNPKAANESMVLEKDVEELLDTRQRPE